MRLLLALAALPTLAAAEPPRVVADIAPIHGIAAAVMAGMAEPALLSTGDAHGGALRPSAAAALQGAEIVVRAGGGVAPWLDGALADLAPGATVFAFTEGEGEDDHGHDDGDGEDHAEDGDHADHGHEAGGDPHVWLDPARTLEEAGHLVELLSARDPDNAARYAANLEALAAEVLPLAEAIRADHPEGRDVLAGHDAWSHAAEAFGLRVLAAAADAEAAAARPAEMAAFAEAAGRADCLLAGSASEAERLSPLAPGIPVAVADPDGTDVTPGPAHYPAMLRALRAALAVCAD